jgi:hypothetical protein
MKFLWTVISLSVIGIAFAETPLGTWHIDANGFKGNFTIQSADSKGNLAGIINIDNGFTDTLQGIWNEAAQEIKFDRIRQSSTGQGWTQTYTGYKFSTKEPIFEGHGAPEASLNAQLLTGYFEDLSSRCGWVAEKRV